MARQLLKQIERQLILYDIFQTNEEDTRISTIKYHLPGMNARMLQRDIRDLTEAGLVQVYFSRVRDAYIDYEGNQDFSFYSESIQKKDSPKESGTHQGKGTFGT